MYRTVFLMKDKSIITMMVENYTNDEMIVDSGFNWHDISSYRVYFGK